MFTRVALLVVRKAVERDSVSSMDRLQFRRISDVHVTYMNGPRVEP